MQRFSLTVLCSGPHRCWVGLWSSVTAARRFWGSYLCLSAPEKQWWSSKRALIHICSPSLICCQRGRRLGLNCPSRWRAVVTQKCLIMWMWLCLTELTSCKMPQSGHGAENRPEVFIRVSVVHLPSVAPSHSAWADVTYIAPACFFQPSSGPWGLCLLWFILRLETQRHSSAVLLPAVLPCSSSGIPCLLLSPL